MPGWKCGRWGWLVLPTALLSACSWGDYTRDHVTGCRVKVPPIYQGHEVKWTGACENGVAAGPGVIKWSLRGVPTGAMGTCIESETQSCRGAGGGAARQP